MARKKELKKGKWTKDDIRYLKANFKNKSTAEVADELGRPLENVKKKASRMGLLKNLSYLKKLGRYPR